uniref:Uncharacterized protein n=1 Tax=Alexandrium monilatum TaxID=311494 RepID=A0A7S4PZZ5_9DINO
MVRRRKEQDAKCGGGDTWDLRVPTSCHSDSDLICGVLTAGLADLPHGDSLGRSAACAARRRDIWTFLALLDCVVHFREDAEVYEIWTGLDEADAAGRRLYAERLHLAGQVLRGLFLATSCLAHVDGFNRDVEEEYSQLGKAMRRLEGRLERISNAIKTLDCGLAGELPGDCAVAPAEADEVLETLRPDEDSEQLTLKLDLMSTAGRMLSPLCEIPRSIGACVIGDWGGEALQGRRGRSVARRAAAALQAEQRSSGSLFERFVVGASHYLYCASVGMFMA